MEISRDRYLEKIRKLMVNGQVKIITGIRRCGKSYSLFNVFKQHLLERGVSEAQIVEVHLDEDDYGSLRDPRELSRCIKDRLLKDDDGVVTVGVIPFLLDREIVGL